MNINWKLRMKNKATLSALVLGLVALVYQVLAVAGVVSPVSESEVTGIIMMVIDLLVLMGVVVDPTTEGIADSDWANSYLEPAPNCITTAKAVCVDEVIADDDEDGDSHEW